MRACIYMDDRTHVDMYMPLTDLDLEEGARGALREGLEDVHHLVGSFAFAAEYRKKVGWWGVEVRLGSIGRR